jgi:redox-sensitive bicupin YhaK (pirin superfamily)
MSSAIKQTFPLGTPPWPTADPFLFCVHHNDHFPPGNDDLGPKASLVGRNIGSDFSGKDGWSMYHGSTVPGFPQHPHRGFETITVMRTGYLDHSDSTGARARFGPGDVQWMTAGNGVVHSEMMPLLNRDGPNPTEFFQIWLNLPREDKKADPYFTMLWDDTVPAIETHDGGKATVRVVAGAIDGHQPPSPPPNSWASRSESDIAVWTGAMERGARFELPTGQAESNRVLYAFRGDLVVDGTTVEAGHGVVLDPAQSVVLEAPSGADWLVLQGRPIGEPVVQHGPFVMNTPGEIKQAFLDYQRTQFGGWPFDTAMPVHGRDAGRFAVHTDGREERPEG